MQTRTFSLPDDKFVTVAFNDDFSGMASVRWGDVMTGQGVEIPAIVLTVGVAELAGPLWELAENAADLKDKAADFTWRYTAEDWDEHNKLIPKPLDTAEQIGYNRDDAE